MKKLKSILIVVLILIVITSCAKESKSSIKDGEFVIELLFEHDNCKVYRFKDGGRFIYWSNCSGNTRTHYTNTNGKTTVTNVVESFTNE